MVCAVWEGFNPINGDWFHLGVSPEGTFDVGTGMVGGAWATPDVDPPESGVSMRRAFDIERATVVNGFNIRIHWYYNADHDLSSLDVAPLVDDGDLTVGVSMKISGNAQTITAVAHENRQSATMVSHLASSPDVTDAFAAGDGWARGTVHELRVGVSGSTCSTESDEYGPHSHAYTIPAGFNVGGTQFVTITLDFNLLFEWFVVTDVYPNPGEVWITDIDFLDDSGVQFGCPPEIGPCGCVPFDGVGEPTANQPIQDEPLGIGDGSTKIFTTAWPYNPQTLEVEVDDGTGGEGVEVDPTDYLAGTVTLDVAPAIGDLVTASYRRAEFA